MSAQSPHQHLLVFPIVQDGPSNLEGKRNQCIPSNQGLAQSLLQASRYTPCTPAYPPEASTDKHNLCRLGKPFGISRVCARAQMDGGKSQLQVTFSYLTFELREPSCSARATVSLRPLRSRRHCCDQRPKERLCTKQQQPPNSRGTRN